MNSEKSSLSEASVVEDSTTCSTGAGGAGGVATTFCLEEEDLVLEVFLALDEDDDVIR